MLKNTHLIELNYYYNHNHHYILFDIFAPRSFTLALNDYFFFVLPIPRSGFLSDPDQPSAQIAGTAKRLLYYSVDCDTL